MASSRQARSKALPHRGDLSNAWRDSAGPLGAGQQLGSGDEQSVVAGRDVVPSVEQVQPGVRAVGLRDGDLPLASTSADTPGTGPDQACSTATSAGVGPEPGSEEPFSVTNARCSGAPPSTA